MAQEQFAGPEYFTDFDPEKFAEMIKQQAAAEKAARKLTPESITEDSGEEKN
ncbi:Uncharacterised protein [Corynebacterium kutscheri]|uniref:Uncharacterized protein n=1 Tax=Corynebacterium kutscheri TaxID=35755 RepID=A0A0F6QZY5_9CORY|nr:hypothetical protein [Corynebacterium kutscheri]AKE40985.1 hypothetical protein UL82_03900 [Corynebacterium kutscheri]VEH06855.1 Uncharacterised protein [Corynebacterium kutscheri]VEH09283.1 Uncharacterised protein [Corynebacterium kutscheri]VEH79371.1 Uncharacterised protein [Corynebacterium kutscheri]